MKLEKVTFGYGEPLFEDLSIAFTPGRITAILGGSGVGKTTLLQLVAGLRTPKAGEIAQARVSYLFQQPRLLPSASVLDNLLLTMSNPDPEKAMQWLQEVEMDKHARLFPRQLSGGMAQRVAMARAFAYEADVLLMDEPFRGLDVGLRLRLYEVFKRAWQAHPKTTLLVTHDPEEALVLADEVVLLAGQPVQVVYRSEVNEGTREELLEKLKLHLMH